MGVRGNACDLRTELWARSSPRRKPGSSNYLKRLDSVFRRNDGQGSRTKGKRLKSQALPGPPSAKTFKIWVGCSHHSGSTSLIAYLLVQVRSPVPQGPEI